MALHTGSEALAPGAFARKMIARYEAELERTSAETDTGLAHREIVKLVLADWKARLARVLAKSPSRPTDENDR